MLITAAKQQTQHGWLVGGCVGRVGEWMRWVRGCLDVWMSGQVARAVDATPDCRNVKTSGIRRLSLTRDMRHGQFGIRGLCPALRAVLWFGLVDLTSEWDMVCSVARVPGWARPGQVRRQG